MSRDATDRRGGDRRKAPFTPREPERRVSPDRRHDLSRIAHDAMVERGFWPEFGPRVDEEVAALSEAALHDGAVRDLRDRLWFSVDNDDSRDLDQISVAEALAGGEIRLLVGIADVDVLAKKGSAVDDHARHNTTSVYTAGGVFTMLPQRLCYDLTSLNPDEDRMAMVVEMTVGLDGSVRDGGVYPARVRNKAKMAYHAVAAWLEDGGPEPPAMAATPGIAEQVRLQDEAAQRMKELRYEHGALDLMTIEARPKWEGKVLVGLEAERPSRAKELIENLMIAANGVTARYLETRGYPSLRRVVETPERWPKIVALAAEQGEKLPPDPDCKALSEFLTRRRKADPTRFPDLSLTVVKLLGKGEYVVDLPSRPAPGHFGLAVADYAHSTAPNRRYPDVVTQRLLKAAIEKRPAPYGADELASLAAHCTAKEDDANKVERRMRKSAAALLLSTRIGDRFDAVVSGASEKGTWVRVFHPAVEGKLVHGQEGLDVGDRVRVKLIETDVERGFIDFVRTRR